MWPESAKGNSVFALGEVWKQKTGSEVQKQVTNLPETPRNRKEVKR